MRDLNVAPKITDAESLVVAVGPAAGFKQQNCYFTKTRTQPERLSLMI